ncbi:MAG: ATP synthase F1 subunit delta [Bacteroidota bacterium]
MDNPRVNIRYARALFDLALENNVLEQAQTDMLLLAGVCRQNRDLRLMLKSPVIMVDKKTAIMRSLFGTSMGKLSLAFIDIIIRKRREAHLYNIALKFGDLFREHGNIRKAVVTTVSPLSEAMRKQLLEIMSEQTGSTIELKEVTDSSIIGGMIVELDGIQFDDSIRNKLFNLRKEFNVNTYIKDF